MSQSGARFTFRANRDLGRHGWLRLTPAYSVGLVSELTGSLGPGDRVLDPFCGTGTTALVCAERGIACDTIDINPFLIWLTQVKCGAYGPTEIESAREIIRAAASAEPRSSDWRPPMHKIERWWDEVTLGRLAAGWRSIGETGAAREATALARTAFCRAMIATSKASFRHQSMSLSHDISHQSHQPDVAVEVMNDAFETIARSAGGAPAGPVNVIEGDSRLLDRITGLERYSAVITSPPYPNRMSYVRELRPYMYWLGFLADGRAAGELDWSAIGGTWGIATSNLSRWSPALVEAAVLDSAITNAIRARSPLLANYVSKYVEDMTAHIGSLGAVMRPGGRATYIIGNSHFYGTPVETQEIFAELFRRNGFEKVEIQTLRKRTSKTGLFEYAVSAIWPE